MTYNVFGETLKTLLIAIRLKSLIHVSIDT